MTTDTSKKPLVWVDGELLPRGEARISVYDKCVLYGDGAFEGIRAYNGRVFKRRSHLERLFRSADALRIKIPYSLDELGGIIDKTLNANGFKTAYIRLVVTRGDGDLGLDYHLCPTPSVFCITDVLQLFPEEFYRKGMPAIIAKRPRIPIECLDPRIKSCNYLNNILGKMEATDAGAGEAIMLDKDGVVCEGSGVNIFMVKDGALATPPGDVGILEGVTRSFVMDLCTEMRLACEEKRFSKDELFTADEVFFSGTGAEIISASSIDGRPVGTGSEGPITERIRVRFHEIMNSGDAPED